MRSAHHGIGLALVSIVGACTSPPPTTVDAAHVDAGDTGVSSAADAGAGTDTGTGDTGTTPVDAGTGTALSCVAGNALAVASMGSDAPDGTGTATSVITIQHVGGTGTYPRVTSMDPGTFGMPCPTDACVKTAAAVSGVLAPFDEEITVNLRGPMELYDFAAYQPTAGSWQRVSSWNRCGADNVTFVNNLGGGASGVWTTCGGNSQSYANADGTMSAAAPTMFAGSLANGTEVNVLSAVACDGATDGSACGFSRGVALHGWTGPRVIAMRARMPRYTGTPHGSYNDAPAIWMLNARIVRTAQYGCNCRGVGSPGGCGELDVAEVLTGSHLTHATSTIYSFQGAVGADGSSGSGHYFLRPVDESATFVVVFDASGTIQMLRLAPDAFDFGPSVDAATVTAWMGMTGYAMSLP